MGGGYERYHLDFPGKKEAIVEANRKTTKTLRPIKEKSVDFDNTKNIYIEGDNLEALKILQESYLGKIKCIYIDPPYNTGNDFVYNDKFSRSTKEEMIADGRMDKDGNILVSKDINNDSNGRYHSDWLKMMYPRLKLARNLLSDDGVIFISIDDNELYSLKNLCDELFGINSFVCNFVRTTRKGGGAMSKFVSIDNDYCLLYAKNLSKLSRLFVDFDNEYLKRYKEQDEKGKYFWDTFARNRQGSSNKYTIIAPDGTELNGAWIYQKEKFEELLKDGDVRIKKIGDSWSVQCKQRLNESGQIMRSQIDDFTNEMGTKVLIELLGREIFTYGKPYELIKYLIKVIAKKADIVLDFFSGSATTAHAVMKLNSEDQGNRQFILVQLPEATDEESEAYKADYKTICDIGEERIRRAGKKIKEENPLITKDLDTGFRVYKVDDSNMKDIYYTPDKISQNNILDMISNVKEDRTAEDLLTQVMLNLGLPLNLHIEEKKIGKNKVFFVEKNSLVACFDDKVDISILDEISKASPLKICLRESSFDKDQDKINFFERLKKLSPDTEATII